MKNNILITAILLCFVSFANAQSFHIGAKGGATLNKLTGKSFKDEFSFGYHAGGYAEIGIGKKFSIQPEVLFNQVNVDTTSQFNQLYKSLLSSNVSKIKLSYISIPILLNYKPVKFLTLQAGPQFGILRDQNKNFLQNGKAAFKDGDLSLLGGVQLSFAKIKMYGRYAVGLNNLNDIDNQDKWKSQSIQLGIGFNIF
ncbi:PorT family protein [Ferruginibacter lapsinanis]|uniref:porin family protein n=1 Tax=Ferruginibacter lapsinanis TaxID=563172 RepID=UPI001E4ABAB8|nr:porin family protein [Ferruginibacter lapsinanis]UEG49828.1 PorT family protein [Ferruginibacter lapsinanis]